MKRISKLSLVSALCALPLSANAEATCPEQTVSWSSSCKALVYETKDGQIATATSRAFEKNNQFIGGGLAKFKCEVGQFKLLAGSTCTESVVDPLKTNRVRQMVASKPLVISSTTNLAPVTAPNKQEAQAVSSLTNTIGAWTSGLQEQITQNHTWTQAAINDNKAYTDQIAQQSTGGGSLVLLNPHIRIETSGVVDLSQFVPAGVKQVEMLATLNTHWNMGGWIHWNDQCLICPSQAGQDYGFVSREFFTAPATTQKFTWPNGNSTLYITGYYQ